MGHAQLVFDVLPHSDCLRFLEPIGCSVKKVGKWTNGEIIVAIKKKWNRVWRYRSIKHNTTRCQSVSADSRESIAQSNVSYR
jgi:hypothetical protein